MLCHKYLDVVAMNFVASFACVHNYDNYELLLGASWPCSCVFQDRMGDYSNGGGWNSYSSKGHDKGVGKNGGKGKY
jgi:hypothetical protein